jgi:hypothetical protein
MNLPALCAEALLQPRLPDTHRHAAIAALTSFIDDEAQCLDVVERLVTELASDLHPECVTHSLVKVALWAATVERIPMLDVANHLDALLHTRLENGAVEAAGRLLGLALVCPSWLPELREATLRRHLDAAESAATRTPDEITRDARVLGNWCEERETLPTWARARLSRSADALECLRDEQVASLHAEHPTAETWRALTRPHTFAWLEGDETPLPPIATDAVAAEAALLDALTPARRSAASDSGVDEEDLSRFSLLYHWERQWRLIDTLKGDARKRGIEVLRACIERTERQLVDDRTRLARLNAEP